MWKILIRPKLNFCYEKYNSLKNIQGVINSILETGVPGWLSVKPPILAQVMPQIYEVCYSCL